MHNQLQLQLQLQLQFLMKSQTEQLGKEKKLPRYLVARKLLVDLILQEKYQVNERIPSVIKLAERIGVGRFPSQQAVKILEKEGVLRNVLGSGCYVKRIPVLEIEPKGNSVSGASVLGEKIWNYIVSPGNVVSPKKIRIGLFPELPEHILLWKKLFAQYMSKHKTIKIEIVSLDFPALLFDHRIFKKIDLFQIPIYLLPFFAESGLLFDLDEMGGLQLSPDDFYDGILQASSYKNKVYGVPIVTSVICQFYNKKYEDIIKEIFPVKGFWDYMEKLEALSKEIKSRDYDFLVTNTESLFTLSMLTKAKEMPSYEDKKKFNSLDFMNFIDRFQKYYTNTKIFDSEIDFPVALNRFFNEKSVILTASTSPISEFFGNCPFQLKTMSQIIEPKGARRLDGNLNVVSASTPFPEECLSILKYFSHYETQLFLAQNGRLVAHKKANKSLVMKNFDKGSIDEILRSFDHTKVISTKDPYIEEYISTIANHEIQKWQQKKLSNQELISSLKRKTNFFYRSKFLINNNNFNAVQYQTNAY